MPLCGTTIFHEYAPGDIALIIRRAHPRRVLDVEPSSYGYIAPSNSSSSELFNVDELVTPSDASHVLSQPVHMSAALSGSTARSPFGLAISRSKREYGKEVHACDVKRPKL